MFLFRWIDWTWTDGSRGQQLTQPGHSRKSSKMATINSFAPSMHMLLLISKGKDDFAYAWILVDLFLDQWNMAEVMLSDFWLQEKSAASVLVSQNIHSWNPATVPWGSPSIPKERQWNLSTDESVETPADHQHQPACHVTVLSRKCNPSALVQQPQFRSPSWCCMEQRWATQPSPAQTSDPPIMKSNTIFLSHQVLG